MKIELVKPPSHEYIDFLGHELDREGELGVESVGFFIKDANSKLVGGCNGFVICGCIYTDQLWIDESLRGQGFGRRLMESMHEYGRKHGCKMATVQTMSIQNKREFYEHLGYKCDLERSGYSNGIKLLCMKKEL